mmetsp:Transcript_4302/g.9502  ORF Transcript_4302/g.9502 Transcript_4302/m.9502 type:complete len:283 (-) Transcript_4302:1393-2241(-)
MRRYSSFFCRISIIVRKKSASVVQPDQVRSRKRIEVYSQRPTSDPPTPPKPATAPAPPEPASSVPSPIHCHSPVNPIAPSNRPICSVVSPFPSIAPKYSNKALIASSFHSLSIICLSSICRSSTASAPAPTPAPASLASAKEDILVAFFLLWTRKMVDRRELLWEILATMRRARFLASVSVFRAFMWSARWSRARDTSPLIPRFLPSLPPPLPRVVSSWESILLLVGSTELRPTRPIVRCTPAVGSTTSSSLDPLAPTLSPAPTSACLSTSAWYSTAFSIHW